MKELTGVPSIDKPWLKYYDEKSLNLEVPDMSIYQMVELYTKNYLDDIALELRISSNNFSHGNTITYKKYLELMKNFAKSLKSIGVKNNEIISTILPNIPESRVSIYGSSIVGATPYSYAPFFSPDKLNKILDENDIKNMFIFLPFYEKFKDVILSHKLENVIFLDGLESLPSLISSYYRIKNNIKIPNKENYISYSEFINYGKKIKSNIKSYYEKDHVALIVGTSGTTGVPKGVCLTDYNLNASALEHISIGLFKEKDVFLDVLLQSIAYGAAAMHYTTCGGLKSILIPELVSDKLPYLLMKTKPDHFLGGPIHCLNIYNSEEFKTGKIKPIKNYVSGGASLKKSLEKGLNKVEENFCENGIPTDLFVRQGLGSTENTGGGFYAMPGSYKFGGVGIPLPLVTAGIFEPGTDKELSYNQEGELCITGPTVMKEYLNNDVETKKVLIKHKDGKLWLHMGDLGYIDKDGVFYHKYRLTNMFMRTGFKIHPGKIMEFLDNLEYVKNSGVIGVEDPIEEMVPIAFVSLNNVFKNNEEEIKKEIYRLCRIKLDDPSIPKEIIFLDHLPINMGGKVDLPSLSKIYQENYNSSKLTLKK